ncbi:hypothetical protein NC651_026020 [Populus alba x Populus x berolinensis]|nr:hypothetical protein NC651_026020 [Populus alba x Populus x berolinensis]
MDVEDPQKLATEKTPNPNTEDDLEEERSLQEEMTTHLSLPYQPSPPCNINGLSGSIIHLPKPNKPVGGSSLRSIFTFSTIEEFWSVYNNIHHPSKLAVGADFHCFKDKIEPKWEDPICANGGNKGKSDTFWLTTLLAMIGEQFDHGDEICGAVVNLSIIQELVSGLGIKACESKPVTPYIGAFKLGNKFASSVSRLAISHQMFISTFHLDTYGYSFACINEAHKTVLTGLKSNFFANEVSIGKQWKEFLDNNEPIGFIFHDDAKKDRNAKNRYSSNEQLHLK